MPCGGSSQEKCYRAKIGSNNGTNSMGVERELRKAIGEWSQKEISEFFFKGNLMGG